MHPLDDTGFVPGSGFYCQLPGPGLAIPQAFRRKSFANKIRRRHVDCLGGMRAPVGITEVNANVRQFGDWSNARKIAKRVNEAAESVAVLFFIKKRIAYGIPQKKNIFPRPRCNWPSRVSGSACFCCIGTSSRIYFTFHHPR